MRYAIIATLLLICSGCGHGAFQLEPQDLGPDTGAVFGRVRAISNGHVSTDTCGLELVDAHGETIKKIRLDETGWFYVNVPVGDVYLTPLFCSMMSDSGKPEYVNTRELHFRVPGGRKIVYTGHITAKFVHTRESGSAVMPFVIPVGPLLVVGSVKTGKTQLDENFDVEDGFGLAVDDFKKRYALDARSMQPINGYAMLKRK